MQQMIEDLGGPDELTAMQRGVLEAWLAAQVCADVEFQRLVTGSATEVPERLMTSLNAARGALAALGLQRRSRDVTPDLATYLKEREAAEDRAGQENGSQHAQPGVQGGDGE